MSSRTTFSLLLFTMALVLFGMSQRDLPSGVAPVGASRAPALAADSSASPATDAAARAAGASGDWWQTVSAELGRMEYQVTTSAAGLQAPNRAHGFRTNFQPGGIEIVPRAADGEPPWRWRFATRRFGRAGALVELGTAEAEASGCRVSYVRPGFIEWYENSRGGLEQGFTVQERPAGAGPLCIRGDWGGGLRAEHREEERAVDFLDVGGVRVLRYGGLVVRDATGAEVASRLVLAGSELAMEIEDGGATYPLTVDPLMSSPAWTAVGNQVGEQFGWSVATAGDVNGDGFSDVIVGAPYYGVSSPWTAEGRALVYHGSAAGLAATPAWTAEGSQVGAMFGFSAATAGDVNGDGYSDVIVGAPWYTNGQADEGRAFVYLGSAAGLAGAHSWTAESNQVGAMFGFSVATAGDVDNNGYSDVIVGAPWYTNGQTREGRAYVYHGSAGGLATTAAWRAESNRVDAGFGDSLCTAGDVNGDGYSDVIVGAPFYTDGQFNEGRAYVYHGSAAGLSAAYAWTVESNQDNARFGHVGAAGDVNGDGFSDVLVGGRQGVFAYHGSAAGLAATPAWTAVDHFYVATAGDVNGDGFSDVIVGTNEVHTYHGSASGLATTPFWTAEGPYNLSGATAGDVNGDGFSDVIVGAEIGYGQAAVYHGFAAGLANAPDWTEEGTQIDADFGASVATAGDVNGDGYSDVIVGAPYYDNGESDEGRAFVYHGSAAGLRTNPAWMDESNQAGAAFGRSVATAGDVNGDGYSDIIVGANWYDNGENNEGRVYAYHGSTAGLAATPAWTAESNQVDAYMGFSVGTGGDVDGDGYSDVIVGAGHYDNGETDEGRAYVYLGSGSGLATDAAWTAEVNLANAFFGYSVATAGDVNGDGYSDVIVGAYGRGRTFAYHGSVTGVGADPAWTAEGDQAGAHFGISVATAGDVNGDGFSDVIVGADWYDNVQSDEGWALVYHGSVVGLANTPAWTAESNDAGANFGHSVATAGDVNGDGFSDVIVGAPRALNQEKGRAFVYHGGPNGSALTPAWTAQGTQTGAEFGRVVGTAGDVNGDGFSDVIVSAPFSHDKGGAFVHLGNEGDGLDRIPRMARAGDLAPIYLLGRSDSPWAFWLKVLGRTPAGRGKVRLEWEVKPAAVPFDGTGLMRGVVFDTGVPSAAGSCVPLEELATGLVPDRLYHWRMRILGNSPFFPRSPWLWLPYNAVTEADVRTAMPEAIGDVGSAPARLFLEPVAPNPVSGEIVLRYTLPAAGRVRLAVYDVAGRFIASPVDALEVEGRHVVRWDGRDARGSAMPAGTYFARFSFSGHKETQKIAVVR